MTPHTSCLTNFLGITVYCIKNLDFTFSAHDAITVDCIKNLDITFSAHDAFMEYSSSGTLKVERLESQIMFS